MDEPTPNCYAEQPQGTTIKNTFLEFENAEQNFRNLRRVASDSDLSTLSRSKCLSVSTAPSSSIGKISTAGTTTPEWPEQGPRSSETPEKCSMYLYSCLLDLYQARRNAQSDAEELQAKLDNLEQLRQHIPMDQEVMSFGSIAHLESCGESCVPCRYWESGRCKKGTLCLFCHLPHPNKMPEACRPSKKRRDRMKRAAEKNSVDEDGLMCYPCPRWSPSPPAGTWSVVPSSPQHDVGNYQQHDEVGDANQASWAHGQHTIRPQLQPRLPKKLISL